MNDELNELNNTTFNAELELKILKKRYIGLLDNLNAGVIVHSKDTSIIFSNARAGELLGLSPDQLYGKQSIDPRWKFLREDKTVCPHLEYPVNQILNTGKAIRNQTVGVFRPESKDTVWLSVNGFASFNDDNSLQEIVISFIDITDRVNSNLQLQDLASTLQAANTQKDKFFNIIAHDLRNPFLGILGISEMMEAKLKEDIAEKFNDLMQFVELIQSSSKSAFALLENLMNWARQQTGDIPFNPIQLPLEPIISSTLELNQSNAFKKNIDIEINLTTHSVVFADENFTSTILQNLLSNAIKFSYPSSKVILATRSIDNFLEFSVQDFGTGIKEENIDKLFRIDTKFSKPGTSEEKGTGLGLILCKELIEKQGGKILVNSKIGIGSTFAFTLPLYKE